jgi:hypothetical protein
MECFVNNHALKIYDLFDYDGITAPRKHPITRPAYILHEDYFYQFYYGKWKQLDPIAPHLVANWPPPSSLLSPELSLSTAPRRATASSAAPQFGRRWWNPTSDFEKGGQGGR